MSGERARRTQDRSGTIDLYGLLDVDPDATRAEIRAAYKRLSQDADTAEREALRRAQETLTDPGRRAAYDRELAEARRAGRRSASIAAATGDDTATDVSEDAEIDEDDVDADFDDLAAEEAEEAAVPVNRRGNRRERPRTPPPPPTVFDHEPPKPSAMQADEAKFLLYLAAYQAAAAVVVTIVAHNNKGIYGLLVINLVLAVAITASARLRNRFAALFAALAGGLLGLYPVFVPLAIPHYAVAIWIMLRQNRAARPYAEWRRQERAGGAPSAPVRTARSSDRASNRRPDEVEDDAPVAPRGRRRGRPDVAPPPKTLPTPPASKRYTPPKKKTKRR